MAQQYIPTPLTAILLSTEALLATLLSVLLGYDAPSMRILLGRLLILASLVLRSLGALVHAQPNSTLTNGIAWRSRTAFITLCADAKRQNGVS